MKCDTWKPRILGNIEVCGAGAEPWPRGSGGMELQPASVRLGFHSVLGAAVWLQDRKTSKKKKGNTHSREKEMDLDGPTGASASATKAFQNNDIGIYNIHF